MGRLMTGAAHRPAHDPRIPSEPRAIPRMGDAVLRGGCQRRAPAGAGVPLGLGRVRLRDPHLARSGTCTMLTNRSVYTSLNPEP